VNHDRDGGLVVLDHEVRRLQQELTELERRPERLEPLREILRSVQRLRHAADPDEPRPVRLLRNAVEKVTLHVGRSRLAVTPEVLDFYVDTVDLLEDAVRRWPAGADFDPRRYAERVRELLDTSAPTRDEAAVGAGPSMAEESVDETVADSIQLTGPETAPHGAADAFGGAGGAAEGALPSASGAVEVEEPPDRDAIELPDEPAAAEEEVEPAYAAAEVEPLAPPDDRREAAERTEAARPAFAEEGGAAVEVEVLSESDLGFDDRSGFVYADLRDLLAAPWTAPARDEEDRSGAAAAAASERAGGLAASFSTFEELRETRIETALAAPEPARAHGAEALAGLRDVLDAFSLSLQDLERSSDRLLEDAGAGIGGETFGALAGRLDAEKRKLLEVFDRAIEGFRRRSG
jgi:chemotaxis protein histidine kinase CheA